MTPAIPISRHDRRVGRPRFLAALAAVAAGAYALASAMWFVGAEQGTLWRVFLVVLGVWMLGHGALLLSGWGRSPMFVNGTGPLFLIYGVMMLLLQFFFIATAPPDAPPTVAPGFAALDVPFVLLALLLAAAGFSMAVLQRRARSGRSRMA